MASSKRRLKAKAQKASRKAQLRAQYAAMRTDEERKQLNPKVRYQRRLLERRSGQPVKARPLPSKWMALALFATRAG